MRIGVDFDNTIICYDDLFLRAARERGCVLETACASKQDVRDALRRAGQEAAWTELQGYVYGERIRDAAAFPGVCDFFRAARERQVEVCIISHKTRRPFLGLPYDLRQAARQWLEAQPFFLAPHDPADGFVAVRVYFEDTIEDKIRRIGETGCTHFIDDLPEVLADPNFPPQVGRIAFASDERGAAAPGVDFAGDWRAITNFLFPEVSA